MMSGKEMQMPDSKDNLTPAPGLVLVTPDDGERVVGKIAIAGSADASDGVSKGTVVAVGPPRDHRDPDLNEMGLQEGMTVYYTKNGAREIGEQVAVDQGCMLAWE